MGHIPVLLDEILGFAPSARAGILLDVTAGGGGHFFALLKKFSDWRGECWDRDPEAADRISAAGKEFADRYIFKHKRFAEAPHASENFNYILADLGISSFQLDDAHRGISFHSLAPLDFRMNPSEGKTFAVWLAERDERQLGDILVRFGEENNFKRIAAALKKIPASDFVSAKGTAEYLLRELRLMHKPGTLHPLTRTFQALRIAVNDELGELQSFLEWAPRHLAPGGRLAIITFHSLEDRKVKRAFASQGKGFKILTSKALTPTESEASRNSRSRSAKLRVLERVAEGE